MCSLRRDPNSCPSRRPSLEMTSAPVVSPNPAPTRKNLRWMLLIFLCLATHVALIWTLEEPPPRTALAQASTPAVRWLTDSWLLERVTSLPGMHDPAVFALPSLDGFSGSAWLTFKPLQPDFAAQSPASYWLELTEEDLGNVFERLFSTNVPSSIQISDLPLPSFAGGGQPFARELSLPPSSVHASTALAERLPMIGNLPAWTHADLLTNSVVQVLVDARGQCVSSTLLSGCGSKEADSFAVKWALSCRFKPLRAARQNNWTAEPIVSGKLTFTWQTLPPSTTAPANAPPSL